MSGKFVLTRRGDGFMFNLKAGNGEIVLTSERYNSKDAALNGIQSVMTNAGNDARYAMNDAGTHFNLKAANGQVIGTSETYSSPSAAQRGTEAVKRAADGAAIDDQT